MRYLHTMVRVSDLDASLAFFVDALGLVEIRRKDYPSGRFMLIFLAADAQGQGQRQRQGQKHDQEHGAMLELTYNYDREELGGGRNFGHLALEVDDIYAACMRIMTKGITINRPPRDGRMAFVRSPDGISVELLQKNKALEPQEPWKSMENVGEW